MNVHKIFSITNFNSLDIDLRLNDPRQMVKMTFKMTQQVPVNDRMLVFIPLFPAAKVFLPLIVKTARLWSQITLTLTGKSEATSWGSSESNIRFTNFEVCLWKFENGKSHEVIMWCTFWQKITLNKIRGVFFPFLLGQCKAWSFKFHWVCHRPRSFSETGR